MDLRYGLAGPADAANLAALSIEVWLHTYGRDGIRQAFSDYVLNEFTVERFVGHVADPRGAVLKCERGPYLLGYLRLDFEAACPTVPGVTGEIATLYVRSRHARQGIGAGLLAEAAGLCRARGLERFWLAVNHENTPALRFYEAQGFRRQGSRDFELEGERHENFILVRGVGE
ncbi:GNAT family N-acetyltransferase [Pleomorphomonas sp. NRK KF1]|uniref:GNAT family N-acetyltransferase n=1 Tax=Pleomorphomonas sp. NRK KF1 TaxID=2943000 RepID=UPI002044444C|nr:GNAT family N-acetyltransferase [Pleomorphomonas sp. NRK KF1]MCM5554097.1 GNAT family N-acetyltransferase [Pleomorphomonas sp. NRK KF1]